MSNIFLTHTQFHVISASVLALGNADTFNTLVINPYYPSESARRIRQVVKSSGLPFDKILLLNFGPADNEHGWSRDGFRSFFDTRRLLKYIDNHPPDNLFTFSDKKLMETSALHKVTNDYPQSNCVYATDGLASYTRTSNSKDSLESTDSVNSTVYMRAMNIARTDGFTAVLRGILAKCRNQFYALNNSLAKLIVRAVFGHWWDGRPERLIGTSKYIDSCAVYYPNLIHPALSQKEILTIPTERLHSTEITEFARTYWTALPMATTESIDKIDIMIILPAQFNETNAYLKQICKNLVSEGYSIGVKPHPRSLYSVDSVFPNSIKLHAHIPAEMYYIRLRETLQRVIGTSASTGLYTSKLICEDIQSVCIESDTDTTQINDSKRSTLSKMGINFKTQSEYI